MRGKRVRQQTGGARGIPALRSLWRTKRTEAAWLQVDSEAAKCARKGEAMIPQDDESLAVQQIGQVAGSWLWPSFVEATRVLESTRSLSLAHRP